MDSPIFVGGLSRCGKTLLCSLLAAHPNIAMPLKESNLWSYFYGRYGNLKRRDNFERCLAAILRYKGALLLNPNPDRIRAEFWQGEPTYARLFALFQAHYAQQLGKPRWGVQSVSEETYTDLIFAAYPTAKIIQMIRDPRDRYEAQVTTRGGHRWGAVAIATAHWLYAVSLAKHYQQQYPDRYKIVRYETLVAQPEETLGDVCAFLNENYTPAIFGIETTPRYHGKDISTAFIRRFGQVMSKRELASMQAYAKRDMLTHNYELEQIQFSLSDYPLFYFVDQPLNLLYMVTWRILKGIQPKIPARKVYMNSAVLGAMMIAANILLGCGALAKVSRLLL